MTRSPDNDIKTTSDLATLLSVMPVISVNAFRRRYDEIVSPIYDQAAQDAVEGRK